MKRSHALLISLVGLFTSTVALFYIPNPILAYIGMAFLGSVTLIYLLPEGKPDKHLAFPRTHGFFRFLRLTNFATIPLTFVFVFLGVRFAMTSAYLPLALLAALRVLPSLTLGALDHRKRRDLLAKTPTISSLSLVDENPLCKVVGFVHETRTRRRRFGRVLRNVWLVDASLQKVFIPGMAEIKGVTERVREGAKAFVVGPSTTRLGIRAIQPAGYVVLPPSWEGNEAEWFDVIWQRSRRHRLLTSAAGSMVYVVAIMVLGWLASEIATYAGDTAGPVSIALFAALFFGALSEKSARESAVYEVGSYFEPKWHGLSKEARRRRLERLRLEQESGQISKVYLQILEMLEPERV